MLKKIRRGFGADVSTSAAGQAMLQRFHQLSETIPTKGDDINCWNREFSSLVRKLLISKLTKKDMASLLAGLYSYRKTGVTSLDAHLAYVRAFEATSGISHDFLHQAFFGREFTQANEKPLQSTFFGEITSDIRGNIVNTLKRDGYCTLPFTLGKETLRDLQKVSLSMSYKLKDKETPDLPDVIQNLDLKNPPHAVTAAALDSDLQAAQKFTALANDPVILDIATEYLDADAAPIGASLWYSFPSKTPKSESAQLYHYDLDTLRWLKVFYYLSDVGPENGPHKYIEASHRSGAKPRRLLERTYQRIPDKDIHAYQPGEERIATGKAGTVILGDTRAFHKGEALEAGHRLIYQPIYAPSKLSFIQSR